jgi:hypothetical protein
MNLRRLHLSTALFSFVFLLAYAISAVEFAHRKWIPHPTQTTEEGRKLTPGITDARILARQWRGELTMIEATQGSLKFRVMTPLGTGYDVSYSIATGDTSVQTTTVSFMTTLAFIHVSHGPWAVVVALASVGLLTLGLSGVYLWFKNHTERWIGVVLLLIGAGIPLLLMISMRLG